MNIDQKQEILNLRISKQAGIETIARLTAELAQCQEDVTQHNAIKDVLDRHNITSVSKDGCPLKTLGRVSELISKAEAAERERDELKFLLKQFELSKLADIIAKNKALECRLSRYESALRRLRNITDTSTQEPLMNKIIDEALKEGV